MKALIKAVAIATFALGSAAAFAAGNTGNATVSGTTIDNSATANKSVAQVDIGSAFGGGGGFLGLGSTSNSGRATVTNSKITNKASGSNSQAQVRIGSAY